MPHNLYSTAFGFRQRSKHDSTAQSNSPKVAKNRLCVASRRASFQTRSMGASCASAMGVRFELIFEIMSNIQCN